MNFDKRLPKILLIGFSLIVGGLMMVNQHVAANQLTFTVQPELPANQINQQDGFFNIQLAANQKQDLALNYTNNTKQTITVNAKVAAATTNSNGVVEYGPNNIKPDKSQLFNLKNLVNIPAQVTLKAGETKKVIAQVTMPNQDVKGIIAGGLTFSDAARDKANQTNSNKQKGNLAIQNIYSLQMGLLMRQRVTPDFDPQTIQKTGLQMGTVNAGQVNFRNVYNVELQNPLPIYVNQMDVAAQISAKRGSKVLYSAKKTAMQMAPNSNFKYPIALGNGNPLKPGKYHVHVVVFATKDKQGQFQTDIFDGKKTNYQYRWEFDRDFTVSGQQAQKLNRQDVTVKRADLTWLYIGLAILALLLGGLLWFFLWKRRKEAQEVLIGEKVEDMFGKEIEVRRQVTLREYKLLIKHGRRVFLIEPDAYDK
ncbi:MAG: DUF916 and DUF3324 domain-containing protein [Lactobacillaceae bacterium]|jgi:hypothetical protein|nr:DUF916 and DUF3324 domain-containing protein [Lactobacillaceae bacterium]